MTLETQYKAYKQLPPSEQKQFRFMIEAEEHDDRSLATPEFFAEMNRRIEEVQSGKVKAIPANELFDKL